MMASSSELSLDYKPYSHSLLLKSFGEQIDQTQKLEDFLTRLEEERVKIDAFKRELPLCMQLLTNAMEASRQQLQSFKANQGQRPVLEEFIPLKNGNLNSDGSEKVSNNISDKANWMTTAQLWSQPNEAANKNQFAKEADTNGFGAAANNNSKQRNGGGAFLPFSKEMMRSSNSSNSANGSALRALSDLALSSASDHRDLVSDDKNCQDNNDLTKEINSIGSSGKGLSGDHHHGKGSNVASDAQNTNNNSNSTTTTATATTTTQTHRKARRCWSPDLHRRFVNALQMLGGSQVATPKQIRELMKVDGLTNDEVKSHLQKYRLHTRRPSPSPQAAATAAPQLVVLGGIWVSPEYATAAAAAASQGGSPAALYGSHASTHAHPYCMPQAPVPQEFFQAATQQPPPPRPPHHNHQLHHPPNPFHGHQLHVFKTSSHGSPESDLRGTGDRSESIEDGKSESGSWKADSSGEKGRERKALVIREEGEESNGSEITLKF